MGFHEIRLPTRISYGAVGGPKFSTTVQTLASGHEQRNINWSRARREYRIDMSPSRGAEWTELLDFFHARRGRAYGFRLKDFADYQLINGLIGVGDGMATDFQMVKVYEAGGSWPHQRDLCKIVAGSVAVTVGGAAEPGGWSVDETTGILTFEVAPAAVAEVRIDAEFDVPVRFETDVMEAGIPGPDLHDWHSIHLVEVRP